MRQGRYYQDISIDAEKLIRGDRLIGDWGDEPVEVERIWDLGSEVVGRFDDGKDRLIIGRVSIQRPDVIEDSARAVSFVEWGRILGGRAPAETETASFVFRAEGRYWDIHTGEGYLAATSVPDVVSGIDAYQVVEIAEATDTEPEEWIS